MLRPERLTLDSPGSSEAEAWVKSVRQRSPERAAHLLGQGQGARRVQPRAFGIVKMCKFDDDGVLSRSTPNRFAQSRATMRTQWRHIIPVMPDTSSQIFRRRESHHITVLRRPPRRFHPKGNIHLCCQSCRVYSSNAFAVSVSLRKSVAFS